MRSSPDSLHGFGGDELLTGGVGNERIFDGEDRFDPRGPVVPTENPGKDRRLCGIHELGRGERSGEEGRPEITMVLRHHRCPEGYLREGL